MDSGGDAGFGGTRRKVRTKLRGYIPLGGGGGTTRRTGGGDGGGTLTIPPITPTIPQIMDGIFVTVFTAPELVYYLQRIAHFIQMTPAEDFATRVEKDFDGVTPDSVFPSLQRKIRLKAPGNAAAGTEGSDHHVRALHAFQSGSAKWARAYAESDLTTVSLKILALAVARKVDTALLSSARAILEDYVELVVSSLIGGDDSLTLFGEKMRTEYAAKLKAFFNEKGSEHWVESRIPTTMKSFPRALE